MGLTIRGNYKGTIELDGGYSILAKIRTRVANAWDKEFGEHYETLFNATVDFKAFNAKTREILSDDRFKDEDQDIVDFLFASDCEGSIDYKTCKKIYELIKDNNEPAQLRYALFSHNDWEDFKQLLKECYSHRSKMRWS